MKVIFLFVTILFFTEAWCGKVDTIFIPSKTMGMSFKCVVITPDKYRKKKLTFPAIYLLHGYDGKYSDWIRKVPDLVKYADEFGVLIICPDGHRSSWYFDSPLDSTMKYETYIANEVPSYIDAHYRTRKNRNARAITGLSMGGHGGLFLGFRHSDYFGAAGSMSGGFDLYASRNRYDISNRIGDTLNYLQNWKNYSVPGMVENYKGKTDLRIIIDCGVDDFFYPANKQLHDKMVRLKIPHEYIERPGNHSWTYWANAVRYQLFFFSEFFGRQLKS